MNNLEFTLTLNTNGSNSLDAWASDTGRPPAVQIQESEVMQVASLCDTVQPALAGSGHISQDDAFELQLFELELNIRQQAHFLANNYQGFVREQWVMSKEDLAARFKSADAKLLALQRTKATLDKMAAELDAGQAVVKPAGIMERAERDFSRQSLGALVQVQDSLHNLLQTMYLSKDIMLVSQNSGVCQCSLRLTSLANRMCPSLTAVTGALPDLTGNEHGKIVAAQWPPHPQALLPDGKETKNHIDGTNCVLSLQNARTNTQTNTGRPLRRRWISIP